MHCRAWLKPAVAPRLVRVAHIQLRCSVLARVVTKSRHELAAYVSTWYATTTPNESRSLPMALPRARTSSDEVTARTSHVREYVVCDNNTERESLTSNGNFPVLARDVGLV